MHLASDLCLDQSVEQLPPGGKGQGQRMGQDPGPQDSSQENLGCPVTRVRRRLSKEEEKVTQVCLVLL